MQFKSMNDSMKNQMLSGISWSALSYFGQQAIGYLTTLVLARLLSPAEFGLLGMVTVFIGFIIVLQDFGIGASIIQDLDISGDQLSSIFWLNLLFSLSILVLITFGSPYIANFYNTNSIIGLIRFLSIIFPLNSLGLIPDALLTKKMDFKRVTIIQNISTFSGGIIGICLALMGFGVWALAWQQICASIIRVLLLWLIVPWKPSLVFSINQIRTHLKFGFNYQAGSMLNYGTRNLDDMLIGRFIGSDGLGSYQMAYRLMLLPLQNVSKVVGQVMFPALSKIKDDERKVKLAFLKATSLIALITYPMVLGFLVVSPTAIYILLGDQWLGVVPIFQVLCILGVTQSISTNTGWIFLSRGRTDLRLKLQLVFSFFLVSSYVIGLNWGVIGVATCYTVTSLFLTPFQFRVAGKLINMSFKEVWSCVSGILICSTIMAIMVWIFGNLLPQFWSPWMNLIAQGFLGILIYWLLIHLFRINAYFEARDIFWNYLRSHLMKLRSAI